MFQSSQQNLTIEGCHPSHHLFYEILSWRLWKNINGEVHIRRLPPLLSKYFRCLALILRNNITSQLPNPPPLLFGEALVAIEPKDRTFLLDPDNIGVEILVLSSVALISNICLLISEALTGEPNDKDPTFNKEPSADNDEFETILIGNLCDFNKTIV